MEALGAAAGAATFVEIGIKTSRGIYNAISAVKDGPGVVAHLTGDIKELQGVLEQLSRTSFEPPADAAELESPIRKCLEDLTRMEQGLQRLKITPTESQSGRLWKRLRHIFDDKKLEQMRETIKGHTLMLNLRLDILQTSQISLSAAQSSKILQLLQELKHGSATPSRPQPSDHETSAVLPVRNAATPQEGASETKTTDLEQSVSRLMRLVEEKECTVESDDAEQLIQDLELLLDLAQGNEQGDRQQKTDSEARKRYCFHKEEDVSKELKLVRNIIGSAPAVSINKNVPDSFVTTFPHGNIIEQKRKRKVLELNGGTLTITTKKRRRMCPEDASDDTNDSKGNDSARDFVAKISFKPTDSSALLTVSISQAQQLLSHVFSAVPPQFSVGNVWPADAPVFQVAASGNIQELMALLAGDNKFTIRDQDTCGRSLLHHAVPHPSMCKFLISYGLDIDQIARYPELPQLNMSPLHMIYHKKYYNTLSTLLEEGADPTIKTDNWMPPFWLMVGAATARDNQAVRQIIESSPFCSVQCSGHLRGETNVFLASFMPDWAPIDGDGLDVGGQIKNIDFLLERGCSVHDVTSIGETCLHVFFTKAGIAAESSGWVDVLKHVIGRGANVYAVDYRGRTVTDTAYHSGFCYRCEAEKGSFRGDLWDAVLDACGFDLLDFRKQCPRRAEYVYGYTRIDFEAFWKGREHRCPYWDDREWPRIDYPYDLDRHRRILAEICPRGASESSSSSPSGSEEDTEGSRHDRRDGHPSQSPVGGTRVLDEEGFTVGWMCSHCLDQRAQGAGDSDKAEGGDSSVELEQRNIEDSDMDW